MKGVGTPDYAPNSLLGNKIHTLAALQLGLDFEMLPLLTNSVAKSFAHLLIPNRTPGCLGRKSTTDFKMLFLGCQRGCYRV